MSEERYDPRRHTLAYAAHRLEVLSHKTPRVPAREPGAEEQREPTTGELATGGVIDETFFLPGTANVYVGDVPWASQPPPPPWQRIGDPIIVTQTASTTGSHQYCPVCGKVKTYDAHGAYVDVPRIDWCTCESPHFTEERIRQIVTETMMRVLYPESTGAVTHEHRRTRQWDADGTEWRGVLYKVEKE